MDYFKQHEELQRLIEDATGMKHMRLMDESIRKLIEPFRSPYVGALGETLAELQRQSERGQETLQSILGQGLRPTALEEAMRMVAPTSTASLLETMGFRDDAFQTYLKDAVQTRKQTLGMLESLRTNIGAMPDWGEWSRRSIQSEIEGIASLTSALPPSTTATVAAAVDGWRMMLTEHSLGAASSAIANPLLESARVLRQSSEFLARHGDPVVRSAVEKAIALNDVELRLTQDLIGTFHAVEYGEGDDADETEVRAPRLFVPRRQRLEAQREAAALDGLGIDEVLAVLPVGQIVLVAREVVGVVSDINETRVIAGGQGIFKVTQRFVRVAAELPFASAENERTFADIVDFLYWLLYEGAGRDSLRYLASNGGPLDVAECDVVFFVKRLRNYYRHDPEHGTDREIRKKLEALLADLSKRGFPALPKTRDEFGRLHRMLLEEAAAFVRLLRDRL